MARDHARILLSIWDNDDFKALTMAAQTTYFTVVSHRDLSYAGVMPYLPSRLRKSKDATEAKVKAALRELEARRFILIDHDTSELLARTYVRHDGVFTRANMGKAVATAVRKIHSATLRDAVLAEIARVLVEAPTKPGLSGFAAIAAPEFERVQALAKTVRLHERRGVA